jgi:hypothetical protein
MTSMEINGKSARRPFYLRTISKLDLGMKTSPSLLGFTPLMIEIFPYLRNIYGELTYSFKSF